MSFLGKIFFSEPSDKPPVNTYRVPRPAAAKPERQAHARYQKGPVDPAATVAASRPTWRQRLSLTPRQRQTLGIALIVLAIYLSIAFLAHFRVGEYDLALVYDDPFPELNPNQPVQNPGGSVGAWVADNVIESGMGVSSLLLPPLLFLMGGTLLDRRWKPWFWRLHPLMLAALFMGTWLMGYLSLAFSWDTFQLAGAGGLVWNRHLNHYLGTVGNALLGLVTAAALGTFYVLAGFRHADRLRHATKTAATLGQTPEDEAPAANLPSDAYAADEAVTQPLHADGLPTLEGSFAPPRGWPEVSTPSVEPEPPLENAPANGVSFIIQAPATDVLVAAPPPPGADNLVEVAQGEYAKYVPPTDQEVLDEEDVVANWEEYDPTLELSDYRFPPIELLNVYENPHGLEVNKTELENNKNQIVSTLGHYGIDISSIKATVGPTVTLYEIVPAPGVRISKIKNLEDDIALSLAALGIRIIAPMPGQGTIGIEIPNSKSETVSLRSVIATEKFRDHKGELPLALGRTISNEVYVADLSRMPHLLVAGATGQGKSVGLNCIIASLVYKRHPAELKFVLIDPKKVEMTLYTLLEKHFLAKLPGYDDAVITDSRQVLAVLSSLCLEMDQRYELLKLARVRNVKEYNTKFKERKLSPRKGHRFLPYIVLVVDELADLMMTAGKEVETPIARLAQLARAVGIHLVVATQRPSVNVITGIIKANFPARLSYRVISKIDSRTILDTNGAEQLVGRGDMLLSTGSEILRIQNAFIDTPEVERLVQFVAHQRGYTQPYYLPEVISDDAPDDDDYQDHGEQDSLFEEAARIVVRSQQGSTSLIQRKLSIGYNRAGRIMDQLERRGIVGPASGSKPREVLVMDETELERFLKKP